MTDLTQYTYGYASSHYKGKKCYVPMIDGRIPSNPAHYQTPQGAVQFSKGIVLAMCSVIKNNGHHVEAVFVPHDQKGA